MISLRATAGYCVLAFTSVSSIADDAETRQGLLNRAEYWELKAEEMQVQRKKLCLVDKMMVETSANLRDKGTEEEYLVSRVKHRLKESGMNDADVRAQVELVRYAYDMPQASSSELGAYIYNNCLERIQAVRN